MSRILLVNNHQEACAELADALRAAGHYVVCAHSGVEAINRFNGTGVDAVVLDVHMPDNDGWRTLKWIRACASPDEIPVIVHSGRLSDAAWSLAQALGANGRSSGGSSGVAEVVQLIDRHAPSAARSPVIAA